jgi:NADPH:quinone reductase-like Zn-dependent oxidoreductase
MRAAAIDRFGGPEVLTVRELPVPELDAGEVLIALDTAGIGRWDADMRGGWYPDGQQPRFPLVLGTDGSGRVAAMGSHIRRFKIGDAVYAYSFANPKGGFVWNRGCARQNLARYRMSLIIARSGVRGGTGAPSPVGYAGRGLA